jgi:hypothetical protein
VASDKSGRTRRPGGAAPDPRVDDGANGDDGRSRRGRVTRESPPDNPLDRITSFETTSRPAAGIPPIVPAERPVDELEEPAPAAVLTAPPPPVALSPDLAPPEPPPAPTQTFPVVESPAAAAALLDLGGRQSGAFVETPEEPRTEVVERVLEPLQALRPSHKPVVFRKARRPRVRRVTRVVRHVDTWSIFKVAFVFNLVLYIVGLTAGVLLWNVAYTTGTIDNIENFFEQFGWESFEFRGGEIYHNLWIAGMFVAIGLTGLAVLLATLFNLITDLVGGIRVTVLEEEVVAKPASRSARVRDGGLALTAPVQPAPSPFEPVSPVASEPTTG